MSSQSSSNPLHSYMTTRMRWVRSWWLLWWLALLIARSYFLQNIPHHVHVLHHLVSHSGILLPFQSPSSSSIPNLALYRHSIYKLNRLFVCQRKQPKECSWDIQWWLHRHKSSRPLLRFSLHIASLLFVLWPDIGNLGEIIRCREYLHGCRNSLFLALNTAY